MDCNKEYYLLITQKIELGARGGGDVIFIQASQHHKIPYQTFCQRQAIKFLFYHRIETKS